MVHDITELNFPKKDGKQYATFTHATPKLDDMGEKSITTQVKIDGDITPDFSYDWEVEFQGEKYIMPLRKPQGAKAQNLYSTIDLTFQHWAIYQLKRWPFVTIQPIQAGTYIADEEVADVILNLGDFCELFGQVLEYYYGDSITIDLNPAWQYKREATAISISHTKIWNVLIETFHSKYGVRWSIEAAAGNDNTVKGGEKYVIKVGYPTTEVDHVFEYGFEGGLLKVERQVQSEEIRNMLKGRGGEKNIPFRYFKNTDPDNPDFEADPDWVEELANIPFNNLRGATFRSYIQGWKAAHISKYPDYTAVGESNAYSPWAYHKGYTDTKFSPVEFIADEITLNPETGDRQIGVLPGYSPYVKKGSSLDNYGPLPDTLDNNDDIYPTLQGTGLDIAVDVEQITDDRHDDTGSASEIAMGGYTAKGSVTPGEIKDITSNATGYFEVPDGLSYNISIGSTIVSAVSSNSIISDRIVLKNTSVSVLDQSGNILPATGVPGGRYRLVLTATVENTHTSTAEVVVDFKNVKRTQGKVDEYNGNTFDIWVRNIWNSSKRPGETDKEYAERVWKPVLGDREKNTAKVVFTSGLLAHEDYEFTIVGFPVLDTSKTWTDEDGAIRNSHWRIKLAKSDAELEATGLYVPSTKKQGKAGDRFVFIGTEMTHNPYVIDAEIRLDDWKKDQLGEVKDIKPTAVVTTDRVRLNNEGKPNALINQLRVGNSLRLFDKRFFNGEGKTYETLYLQSITYTYREPSSDDTALNPDVEIVLGNEYAVSANPISMMQGEISALQRQVGSISNIEQVVKAIGDRTYISKVKPDRASGRIDFKSGLTSGSFVKGYSGAQIDDLGNAEVESITARSFMKVYELIYNRLNSLEGDTSFADSGTIETLEAGADGILTAVMRKRWDGDFTAFQPGDIVYGYVNDLGNAQSKTYGKAWARVTAVDRAANTLTLLPYSDSAVPSGTNLPVTAEMLVTRWGNVINPETEEAQTNPDYASFIKKVGDRWVNTRQQSFFVSTEMGNIVELMGVDAPILRQGNYGTVLGQIPDGLLDENTAKLVNPGQPYLYARGAVIQDLIHIDYTGARIRTPNFRGAWSQTDAQSERGYRMTDDSVDIVSHGGGTWQCCVPKAGPNPPSDSNPDWIRISGTDFAVWEIVPSVNVIYIRDNAWSTNLLECRVRRNNGSDTEEYTTPEELDATGMELVFSMDGITYQEYWTRTGDTIELENGGAIELESGDGSLDIGGNNVPWSEVVDHIWLRLRDKTTKKEAVSFVVPVVRDGANGKDGQAQQGEPGKDGKDGANGKGTENRYRVIDDTAAAPALTDAEKSAREPSGWSVRPGEVGARKAVWMITAAIKGDNTLDGTWSDPIRLTGADGAAGTNGQTGPIAYPCGVFDRLKTYRATAESVPVVQDGKDSQGTAQYYALNPGKVFFAGNGTAEFPGDPDLVYRTPHEDAANNGGFWRRMDSFSMVFADILMARFAKLASAVFYDNLMMSQQGVTDNGVYSERYEDFPQDFNPNLLIDFKKGKITARDVEFYGTARQMTTLVTDDNYTNYLFENHNYTYYAVLDWRKTGGNVDINVISKHIILFLPSFSISVQYDKVEGGLITLSVSDPDEVRRYAGTTAVVRNVNPNSGTRVPPTVKVMGVVEAVGVNIHRIEDGGAHLNCGRGVCFQSYLGTREYRTQDGTVVNSGNSTEELVWRMGNEFDIRGFNRGIVQQS